MRVKSLQSGAPKRYFIPCGVCEECRKAEQSMWSFRLRCQIESLVNQGYRMVFGTLTYNDENLPKVPLDLIDDSWRYDRYNRPVEVPCFDRIQVRRFIDNLRKWMYRYYKVSASSYFLASEFGSSTRRPHYHFIWLLPPSVEPQKFYDEVCRQWKFGFVFPRYYLGGLDSKGHKHKPFLVDSPLDAGAYCAKYCCKDITYIGVLNDAHVLWKSKEFRNYGNFHIQSRSLGFSYLSDLSDDVKIDYLTNGVQFVGSDKKLPLPRYMKQKLLFKIRYDYEEENVVLRDDDNRPCHCEDKIGYFSEKVKVRKVRREPTEFFLRNVRILYESRLKFYTEFVAQCCDKNFYQVNGVDENTALFVATFLNDYLYKAGMTCKDFAECFLCYHRVDYSYCYHVNSTDRYLVWLQRYQPVDFGDCPLIDEDSKYSFDFVCDFVFTTAGFIPRTATQKERLAEFVKDWFKSCA